MEFTPEILETVRPEADELRKQWRTLLDSLPAEPSRAALWLLALAMIRDIIKDAPRQYHEPLAAEFSDMVLAMLKTNRAVP
jgi:hypothetical protein